MRALDVAFAVNGPEGSAAGERAVRIGERMPEATVRVLYRDTGRTGALASMVSSLRDRPPDVVYAMDLAATPIAAWLIGAPRARLIVDTGDTPRQFLDLIQAPLAARCAASVLERVGYRRSSRVVVRGPHHAEQLRSAGHRHVKVIPDGVDLSFFRPHDVATLRHQLGLADALTVGVQGNFTWYPGLGGGLGWELIEAMGRRRDLDVRAVLIGDGPGIAKLRELAAEHGVAGRVHVMGRVPYRDLPRYLSLCDVCLLTQTDDPSSWARTTGKLPGFLAAGRHIIATRVGTASDLLPEAMLLDYRGSWDRTYPDRLGDRLAELCADRDQTIASGLELRTLAATFDYDSIAQHCADEILAVAP